MVIGLNYYSLVRHYERCLEKFGPTPKGMDWPNEKDLIKRFQIMIDITRNELKKNKKVSIMDLGCGVGLLVDFLKKNKIFEKFYYLGIDISNKMISEARKRNPDVNFEVRDILRNPFPPSYVDYVIMNGVLTEKLDLTYEEMKEYAKTLIKESYETARIGVAFNIMSPVVDWYREDLFYWSYDELIDFLVKECSRNIIMRMDYGLYEYTIYLYKKSQL